MKRKALVLISIFFLVAALGLAQAQFKFEVTKEMKGGTAEIMIIGKTFDEVWKGVTQTLLKLKFRIKEKDKDNGMIFAEKRAGLFYEEGDVMPAWDIMIESDKEKIMVFCGYSFGTDTLSAKRPFKKFCEKLKDILSKQEPKEERLLTAGAQRRMLRNS